jgi:hypothetical protein
VTAQIFGEPALLLADVVLPRREGRRLMAWLAALESLARALLLVMAARLPRPAPAKARPRRTRGSGAALDQNTEEHPPSAEPPGSELWAGVVFHAAPRRRGGPRGPETPPRRFLPARALAYRFEALIRVAETPEPFARRLARRLWAEPALAADVLRGPDGEGGPPPWDDLIGAARAQARAAAPVFSPDTG